MWVIEPPFPIDDLKPEDEPPQEKDVPTQVSDYFSDKYSGLWFKLTAVVVFENDEDLLFSLSFFQFPCI